MRDFWETTPVATHNRGQFISTRGTTSGINPIGSIAPVKEHCTRYGALHPIRTGVMPTDRVHDPFDNKHKRGVISRIQPNQKGLKLTDQVQHPIGNKCECGSAHA